MNYVRGRIKRMFIYLYTRYIAAPQRWKPNKVFVCVKFARIRTPSRSFRSHSVKSGSGMAVVACVSIPLETFSLSVCDCKTIAKWLRIFSLFPVLLNSFYLLEIPFDSRYTPFRLSLMKTKHVFIFWKRRNLYAKICAQPICGAFSGSVCEMLTVGR